MKQRPIPADAGIGRCRIITCIVQSSANRLTVLPPAMPASACDDFRVFSRLAMEGPVLLFTLPSATACPDNLRALRPSSARDAGEAPLAPEPDLKEDRARHQRHRRHLGGRGATSAGEECIDLRFLPPGGGDTGGRRPFADEGQKHLCGALTTSLTCKKRGFMSGWGFKIHLAVGCTFVSARRDSSWR